MYVISSKSNKKENEEDNWICLSGAYILIYMCIRSDQISRSVVSDSATPWIAASQASLSITNSWSSLRLTSIEAVMPSSHLMLCRMYIHMCVHICMYVCVYIYIYIYICIYAQGTSTFSWNWLEVYNVYRKRLKSLYL